MHSKIFCLVGGSGSGKDTIKEQLGLPYIISYRTRPIRENEVDHVHGFFVTDELYDFHKSKNMIAAETLYNGHKYWTIQYQFKDYYDNESPLLYVVDGEGVKSLRQTFPSEDVIGIYIDVSLGEMVSRMILRGDNQKNIDSRKRYFEDVVHKDKEVCQYVVDNNDDIVYAVNEVYKIIIKEIF